MNFPNVIAGRMAACLVVLASFASPVVWGVTGSHPLKPPDRSSPRATIQTFLDSTDDLASYVTSHYIPTTSLEAFGVMRRMSEVPVGCIDLSDVPPSARTKGGGAAALALYDTLNRLELPRSNTIPGKIQVSADDEGVFDRWVIPNTEIALVRIKEGPRAGEYLFSPDTVKRAAEFRDRVADRPLLRDVPHPDFGELLIKAGGWPVPISWVEGMPGWLQAPFAGQVVWKWISLLIVLALYLLSIRFAYRMTRLVDEERPLLKGWLSVLFPVFILLATKLVSIVALVPINMFGTAASVIELLETAILFLVAGWLAWRAAPVIAETIVSAPAISNESVDAYVLRVGARILGLVLVAVLLSMGAERLGVPVYGIIAGLGVGGLAIALAAQPTVENLIGSLSIFADKPFKVGDRCEYGGSVGFIESIGIRSTRIRDFDRKVTTIPNRDLANMPLINYSRRDRRLIHTVIGVRYETTPEQLRFLLAKIREMLIAHPQVNRNLLYVRLADFGASSIDFEIFAYIRTRDRLEFYALREDIYLRIMDIISESGTSIAFPSRTVYFGRDPGLDSVSAREAEQKVQQWREDGELPFPLFSREQIAKIRATIEYPPPGSSPLDDEDLPKTS